MLTIHQNHLRTSPKDTRLRPPTRDAQVTYSAENQLLAQFGVNPVLLNGRIWVYSRKIEWNIHKVKGIRIHVLAKMDILGLKPRFPDTGNATRINKLIG